MRQIASVLGMIVVCAPAYSQGGGRTIHPPDPVEEAKVARASQLIDEARQLVRANDDQGAIAKLLEAAAVEETLGHRRFQAYSQYHLARMHVKQNRIPDALAAYRAAFVWRPAGFYGDDWRGDLDIGSNPGIHGIMEYAILLAKQGRAEDAKAIYYFGLRSCLAPRTRSEEPVPFLVVFDPDPEGIYWEYTPQRLEAAALMVQAMLSSGSTDFATNVRTTDRQWVERVRALAPDWFYPVLYMANTKNLDSPAREQLTAQAEAMARPGLERQLMARFRQDIAELLVINEQNDTPGAWDMRPMTEGAERRKRMQCLRPNEQILRRLSIERPQ